MYYHECPCCGAYLDPGEPCDCEIENPPDDGEDRLTETVVAQTTSSISI